MRKQTKTIKIKPPCKPGKSRRNTDGRCVKIKTIKKAIPLEFVELSLSPDSNPVEILSFPVPIPILKQKIKPPCKPGKERNSNGRCVKLQTINKKSRTRKLLSMKLPPCKSGKMRNYRGRCVKIKNIK